MSECGLAIDDEYGVPKENISCPGCGRTYKAVRTVCQNCEECKKCCKCGETSLLPARRMIEEVILPRM